MSRHVRVKNFWVQRRVVRAVRDDANNDAEGDASSAATTAGSHPRAIRRRQKMGLARTRGRLITANCLLSAAKHALDCISLAGEYGRLSLERFGVPPELDELLERVQAIEVDARHLHTLLGRHRQDCS